MAVTGKRQEAGAGGDGDTPAGVGSALPEMLWTLLLDGPEGWLGFHTEGGSGWVRGRRVARRLPPWASGPGHPE